MQLRIVVFLAVIFAVNVNAEQIAAVQASGTNVSALAALSTEIKNVPLLVRSASSNSISPVVVNTNIPGGAGVQISLNRVRYKTWRSYFITDSGEIEDSRDVILLSGERIFDGEKDPQPAAAALWEDDSGLKLHLFFQSAAGDKYHRLSLSLANGGMIASAVLVSSDGGELGSNYCEMNDSASSSPPSDVQAAALRTLEIATEADYEFYSRYGLDSNAEMAAAVNAADVIYRRDLELAFNLTAQASRTSASQPYTSTAASTLLSQFRTYGSSNRHMGNADLYHLFSGKDFDGSTAGIAYLGVVCNTSYGYGTTMDYGRSLNYIIFAHEVGHNLNADHDTNAPGSVMYPSVSTTQTTFSSTSISQVASFVAGASCLSLGASPTPTPTPTPTASPTPTPDPTPVPPGSDPDPRDGPDPTDPADGIPSPQTTELGLSARFSPKTGRAVVALTPSGELGTNCSYVIKASSSLNFADANSVTISAAAGARTIRTSVATRIGGNRPRVYLLAEYQGCDGGGDTVTSRMVSIIPFRYYSYQRLELASRWRKRLLRNLQTAAGS